MKEQLELDIKRILKEKYNTTHFIEVVDFTTVGAQRRCSVKIGEGWIYDGMEYEALNERGQFVYNPEYVADLLIYPIRRFKKYNKKVP